MAGSERKSQLTPSPDDVVEHCPVCGVEDLQRQRFCGHCGHTLRSKDHPSRSTTPLSSGQSRHDGHSHECPRCGVPVCQGCIYCPHCGSLIDSKEPAVSSKALRPAGWYADPFARSVYRWWDGRTWSDYASSDGNSQWDPIPRAEDIEPVRPGIPMLGTALLAFAAAVGLSIVIQIVLYVAGYPGGKLALFVLTELGLWAGLVGGCVVVSRRRGTASLVNDFGLSARPLDIVFGLAASFAARVMVSVAVFPVVVADPNLSGSQSTVFPGLTTTALGWLVVGLVACIGAPLIEELFFRGLMQTRLVGRFGSVWGIGATSVLFGAAHLIGWVGPISLVYALGIAGAGVVLGTVRHMTGRLGTSMATHSFFNLQALLTLALLH